MHVNKLFCSVLMTAPLLHIHPRFGVDNSRSICICSANGLGFTPPHEQTTEQPVDIDLLHPTQEQVEFHFKLVYKCIHLEYEISLATQYSYVCLSMGDRPVADALKDRGAFIIRNWRIQLDCLTCSGRHHSALKCQTHCSRV